MLSRRRIPSAPPMAASYPARPVQHREDGVYNYDYAGGGRGRGLDGGYGYYHPGNGGGRGGWGRAGYHDRGNGYGGGGDGGFQHYGVPGNGVGVGVGHPLPLAAGLPVATTSYLHPHAHGLGWVPDELPRRVMPVAPPPPPPFLPPPLRAAEAAAREVLLRLHPTEEAERRRHKIIDYAKNLIGTTFGCEVFAFGSVPLKTYLPDGDVDITILTNVNLDNNFVQDVCCLLAAEQSNEAAEFALKEIQVINAKVKIIKCVIDNLVMDISFNQVGGVSTLCFLEMANKEIGKDHLFKRSIILIKAWCYHEGNIHGSNHWLMSTYALEVLILYIFNLFHTVLHGPLQALYKFLEYYSKFDWDNQCLTLNGPVPLSSLRNYTAGPTGSNEELLLSKEPLEPSLRRLFDLPAGSDGRGPEFRLKYLNIIDPLKGDNNLGTSISEANSRVIRDAFAAGAEKLGQILKLPCELIAEQVYVFFTHTLGKHGRGERQDLGESVSQSMPDPRNARGQDVSSLGVSCMDEDEKRIHRIPGLTNFRSHSDSSSSLKNGQDVSGSNPVNGSNQTDVQQEKVRLTTHFTPMNLLDLSGHVNLHMTCLRSVQYNLEALHDKLLRSAIEASSAGVLDEERFVVPILRPDPRPSPCPRMPPVSSSVGTGAVPQQPITEVQVQLGYQSTPRTHIPPNGLSGYPPFAGPWFPNTEDMSLAYGATTYMHDMNYSVPLGIDALSSGMPFYPAMWGFRQSRGTGTYIPRTGWDSNRDKWNDRGRMQRQRQSDRGYGDRRPDVGSSNGHATAASVAGQTPPMRGNPHQGASSSNNDQRFENGWVATRMPPRITVPRNGCGSQPSSPVVVVTPAVTMVNGQSVTAEQHENLEFGTMGPFSVARQNSVFDEQFPALQETIRQGQQGPQRSPPKPGVGASPRSWPAEAPGSAVQSPRPGVAMSQSWPNLPAQSPRPVVRTIQSWPNMPSPRPFVGVTQNRPAESPTASTSQSPRPGPIAAQDRAARPYQLQDDADFPPLETENSYDADFPPLQAAVGR
ncbi:hypothetical protein D1007_36663 [Hordeum vulgare]|nr:hypothetical protein D1007_36663 [Hordeum vulgare]